jgi:hypothetical protein
MLDEHCQKLVQEFFTSSNYQSAGLHGKKKRQFTMDFLDMVVDLKQKSILLHEQNLIERNQRCVRKFFAKLKERVLVRKQQTGAKNFSIQHPRDEKASKGIAEARKVQLSINTNVTKEGFAVSPVSSPQFRKKGSPFESPLNTKKKRFALSPLPLASTDSRLGFDAETLNRRGSIRVLKRDTDAEERPDSPDPDQFYLSNRMGVDVRVPKASKFSRRGPTLGFTLHVLTAHPAERPQQAAGLIAQESAGGDGAQRRRLDRLCDFGGH